jgi:hypothetical protein
MLHVNGPAGLAGNVSFGAKNYKVRTVPGVVCDCWNCVTFCQVRADWDKKTRKAHAAAIEQATAAAASAPQPALPVASDIPPPAAAPPAASKVSNPPPAHIAGGPSAVSSPKAKAPNPKPAADVSAQQPQQAPKAASGGAAAAAPRSAAPAVHRGPSPPPKTQEDYHMKVYDCGNEKEIMEIELRNKLPGFKYCSVNKQKKVVGIVCGV